MSVQSHLQERTSDRTVETYADSVSDKAFWFALVVALFLALWIQGPRLMDPYTMEEDARSFYWWITLENPDLFRDSVRYENAIIEVPVGRFRLLVDKKSPGYSLLYQAASPFASPITFSKLLAFPLLLVAVGFLYRIGRNLAGNKTAFIICLAYVLFDLVSPTAISSIGGLQRSFMLPFLLAAIYYLMSGRYNRAAFVLFLSGTIYPSTFVLGAATYGLALIRPGERSWRTIVDWKHLPHLLIVSFLVVLVLSPALLDQVEAAPRQSQSSTTATENYTLLSDPVYQTGGRRELFQYFPLVGRMGIATDGSNVLHITLLSIAAIVTFFLRPKSLLRFPRIFKLLFFASFICFGLAWITALLTNSFPLYLASRYTQASIPLFLLVYVVVNARETISHAASLLHKLRGRLILFVGPVAAMTLLVALFGPTPDEHASSALLFRHSRLILILLSTILLGLSLISSRRGSEDGAQHSEVRLLSTRSSVLLGIVLLLPALFYVNAFHTPFYTASQSERELYQFLETVPQNAMIAGSPCRLSGVPMFAKRMILYSCEDPHPDSSVILDSLEAYYAADPLEVIAFCETYGIDYLVVDSHDFSDEQIQSGVYYFEPQNSQIRPTILGRTSFALSELPDDDKLFVSSESEEGHTLYVVACEALAP